MKKLIVVSLIIFTAVFLSAQYRKAPPFALYNKNDRMVSLSQIIKNRNVVLSFWASYCVPCRKEMPQLKEIEGKFGKTNNFDVVFINIDKEGKNKALPILNDMKIENECLFDIYQLVAKKYIPDLKIPAVIIINRNGDIVFEAIGEKPDNLAKIENFVKMLW